MTLKNDQYDEFTNNYDEMVTEYTNFLQLAKEYSDTRVGRGLNRRSDDKIDTAIAEAEGGKEVLEGGKMTLEETQQMVNQVNEFLVNLQQNTQTSLDIANTFQGAMENAHTYTDIILNTIQVIT